MSVVVPFLALLLTGMFAAYHRMRLAVWAALTAVAHSKDAPTSSAFPTKFIVAFPTATARCRR